MFFMFLLNFSYFHGEVMVLRKGINEKTFSKI